MAARSRAHAHQQQMHYKDLKDMQQKKLKKMSLRSFASKVEGQLNIMFTSDLSWLQCKSRVEFTIYVFIINFFYTVCTN